MTNRLAGATSPYLLQHAQNPVDWREWGDEAFAEARERGVPVLVSVGYAACHWCHVMAHESFEDEATAALMNTRFVNIKVDREERPDVDAVYMQATQAMTGQGGWPMTVFTTPAGAPFFCGTYFPPQPRHGLASFSQVLRAVATTWEERRGEVERSADDIVHHLGAQAAATTRAPGQGAPGAEVLDAALATITQQFDDRHAGFGPAPKFPPSMVLEWLLRHHARTGDAGALEIAARTLEAMARGGIYDQLAGGFARYSVDAAWVVPHFEKMLYDNALLLRVYAHWWRATGSPLARRVVEETAGWLLRDLRTPEGGFASALDADSEGEEGRFYVWTPAQLREVLGEDDGTWAAEILSVTAAGTFEHGSSVLQLLEDPAAGDQPRYHDVRDRLLAARTQRVPPARDDKVVAAWNGLAIAALAEAGALLERQDWVEAAASAAQLLINQHLGSPGATTAGHDPAGDRLARTSRGGVAGASAGVLEDYADVAEGLLELYRVSADEPWLIFAGVLLDVALAHFGDGHGGFFDTADDQTDARLALVRRPQDPTDGPVPAAPAALAGALVSYGALTGSSNHREAGEDALGVVGLIAARHPRAAGWGLAVAEAVADGPREIAIVGPANDPATRALRRVALHAAAPGAVLAVGDPGDGPGVALLADRPLVDGRPTAYVCRSFVCERPTTDPAELSRLLTVSTTVHGA
jgi:uncharacterized protein YyaL (SSP411 family)